MDRSQSTPLSKHRTRRQALGLAISAALALLTGCASLTGSTDRRSGGAARGIADERVLIVGAGIAGLAAARALLQQGIPVQVLEARTRIGGRIWTDTSLGTPLDLGASWIHGSAGNPLTQLAREHGITTVRSDIEDAYLYETSGRELSDARYAETDAIVEAIFVRLYELQETATTDASVADALTTILGDYQLEDALRRAVDWSLVSSINIATGADPTDLSLQHWETDAAFAGDELLFPGGYGQLIQVLARDVPIQRDCVVSAIAYEGEGVRLTTSQGTWEGSRALVTVPLGVLQAGTITFTPALPTGHQQAQRRLAMGTLNKIALQFDRVFWPEDAHSLGVLQRERTRLLEYWSMLPVTGAPILVAMAGGQYARELEALTPEAAADHTLRDLRSIAGGRVPTPVGVLPTRWSADPFARGSYSHVPPRASLQDYASLAAPVGSRLFFAGEATSPNYPATVHGALLSGRRAADDIINRVGS
ncbi:MAG: NAD(P)-binding protein [Chloroflexaceae bacterium]|nr:NAD(P)-binding protein [Chloroflexaceae bacterium]